MAKFHSINLFLTLCFPSLSHRSDDVGGMLGTGAITHSITNMTMFLGKQLGFSRRHKFSALFWLTVIWMYLRDLFVSLILCLSPQPVEIMVDFMFKH